MSGRIVLDNAGLYAAYQNRQTVRDFESTHKNEKCNSLESFQKYLTLLEYSYMAKFLKHQNDPAAFADGAEGHVLGQKLARLLEQLSAFTHYATESVAAQLQEKVNAFWQLGEAWEKKNLKNLKGEPSNWFESVKKHRGLGIYTPPETIPSEGVFRTLVKI